MQDLGYVMSGSRHARMNAIRIRKENQVYTAEEKRELALLRHQQQLQRDDQVVAELREMIYDDLQSSAAGKILAASDV